MTFEDLTLAHFDEWQSPLRPQENAYCGFAGRHDDGLLGAIVVFYADDGEWYAGLARRGFYPAKLHREVFRAMAALRSAGVRMIKAEIDRTVPRAADYLEALGFEPLGDGDLWIKRWNS